MSLLRVADLSLDLDGRRVLSGLNFELSAGAFRILIGPNGAGKSSLLRCLLGIYKGWSGQAWFEGQDLRKMKAKQRARCIGYVPQFLELDFDLEVHEFVGLARFCFDETPSWRERKVADALARVDASAFAARDLSELSGGERQRVLIAAALAQEPKLLVLDEPNQSLDPHHRIELMRLIAALHQEGLTLLLVTHDWNEFLPLYPEVMALKNAKLAFECETAELAERLSGLFDCKFKHFPESGYSLSLPCSKK